VTTTRRYLTRRPRITPASFRRLTAADASPAKHTVQVQLVSERVSRLENVTTYETHGTSAVRLAHGHGEAHAYLLQFEAGGAIGRHESGYGQLFIVLTGRGWVAGHDGLRAEIGTGDVVLFERGEHHAKGSDTGMTAMMVQVRDLSATDATLDSDP
jgi:quercetin dioxygenase-like cupin family protein